MLKADYHRKFHKDYRNLQKGSKQAFNLRLSEFLHNPRSHLLNDHSLKGDMHGKRAFSVTGSIRTIYRYLTPDSILLLRIGPHDKVYD